MKSAAKVPRSEIAHVIGNTISGSAQVAFSGDGTEVAYCAGCVVVVMNASTRKQAAVLRARRPLSAVACCPTGKFVAAGEVEKQGAVIVWNWSSHEELCNLKRHLNGVSHLAFSPNGRYLLSVSDTEGLVVIWLWRKQNTVPIATAKPLVKVTATCFAPDGSSFVTAGARSLKLWGLGEAQKFADKHLAYLTSAYADTATTPTANLEGRPLLIPPEFKEATFVAVQSTTVATKLYFFALTAAGIICCFNQRSIEKFVDAKSAGSFALSANPNFVICGGANGIVRLFSSPGLGYLATFPRAPQGFSASCLSSSFDDSMPGNFASCVAIQQSLTGQLAVCGYSDRSIIVWNLKNAAQIELQSRLQPHSDAVCGLAIVANTSVPPDTLLTCSKDLTVRLWCVDGVQINSAELLAGYNLEGIRQDDTTCSCLSPDGEIFALGGRSGSIALRRTRDFAELCSLWVHSSEVLAIGFAPSDNILATGGRDGAVHIFRSQATGEEVSLNLIKTLKEHTAGVTAVRFSHKEGDPSELRLITCSADSSLIFHTLSAASGQVTRDTSHVTGGSINSAVIDFQMRHILVAGHDRSFRIFSIATGRQSRSYPTTAINADVLCVDMDGTGSFVAAAFSDNIIRIFDFFSGHCVEKAQGHSSTIAGVCFSQKNARLYSVASDGCVICWELGSHVVEQIEVRKRELRSLPSTKPVVAWLSCSPPEGSNVVAQVNENLPAWFSRTKIKQETKGAWARAAQDYSLFEDDMVLCSFSHDREDYPAAAEPNTSEELDFNVSQPGLPNKSASLKKPEPSADEPILQEIPLEILTKETEIRTDEEPPLFDIAVATIPPPALPLVTGEDDGTVLRSVTEFDPFLLDVASTIQHQPPDEAPASVDTTVQSDVSHQSKHEIWMEDKNQKLEQLKIQLRKLQSRPYRVRSAFRRRQLRKSIQSSCELLLSQMNSDAVSTDCESENQQAIQLGLSPPDDTGLSVHVAVVPGLPCSSPVESSSPVITTPRGRSAPLSGAVALEAPLRQLESSLQQCLTVYADLSKPSPSASLSRAQRQKLRAAYETVLRNTCQTIQSALPEEIVPSAYESGDSGQSGLPEVSTLSSIVRTEVDRAMEHWSRHFELMLSASLERGKN
eukprot:TRINITY_DN21614_c0_g1_i1.p1 TRINITY_DN21614_c0_g1~~TRINITY_DN21614_c0_g1_i1.p1  ORF type:complete len:1137 (-),score=150.84 TRINITY_DN21614_c0_g1_i1:21-3404(-)